MSRWMRRAGLRHKAGPWQWLGEPAPLLLLGEAPNAATTTQRGLWLLPDDSEIPHTANRLLRYTGYDHETYMRLFDRENVLHEAPPRGRSGYSFPATVARREVDRLFTDFFVEYRAVLVLGRRLSKIFRWAPRMPDSTLPGATMRAGQAPPNFEWSYIVDHSDDRGGPPSNVPAAVVPHPSGMNRWWNDLENRVAASWFFARLLESETS